MMLLKVSQQNHQDLEHYIQMLLVQVNLMHRLSHYLLAEQYKLLRHK